jgi:hypothetical protein
MPPDEEMVDLIKCVYLEGQIDGVRGDLAYLWLLGATSRKQTIPA